MPIIKRKIGRLNVMRKSYKIVIVNNDCVCPVPEKYNKVVRNFAIIFVCRHLNTVRQSDNIIRIYDIKSSSRNSLTHFVLSEKRFNHIRIKFFHCFKKRSRLIGWICALFAN